VDICSSIGNPVLTCLDVGKNIRNSSPSVTCVYVAEWDGIWVASQLWDTIEVVTIWVGVWCSRAVGRIDYELELELWICCKSGI
jgi:hypothetical protein